MCARYFGAKKKKGKELILLEACVVEMSLEEKQGSPPCCWVRGIIQAHVAGEKPSAPQDLCLGAVATGGLRFHRLGVCAGEGVVLYSQGLKFAVYPSHQAQRCPVPHRRVRGGRVDMADARHAPTPAQTFSPRSLHEPLGDSSSQKLYKQL